MKPKAKSPDSLGGSVAIGDYVAARRRTIESSIAAERLVGNKWKEECERCALAEITALEIWLSDPKPPTDIVDRMLAEYLLPSPCSLLLAPAP